MTLSSALLLFAFLITFPLTFCINTTNDRVVNASATQSGESDQIVRDDLGKAVFVADYPLVQTLVDIYNSGELVAGIPPIVLDRKDERGRTALMKCGFDPQSENKTLVDITCMLITKSLHQAGADITRKMRRVGKKVWIFFVGAAV